MQYKGVQKPLVEIANELGVDAIVEGSVLRAEGRIRITANLIEAATEQNLWAESYERDLRDVLALQSEVAQAIAQEIRVATTPEEQTRLAAAPAVDPESYNLYLLGRHYFNRQLNIEPDLIQAIGYFDQALEVDSKYAPAYAGLASAYALLGRWHVRAPEEAWPKMKMAAERAVALDDELSQAHASLAIVKQYYDWDWTRAEGEFKRALDINPNDADAHSEYSQFLSKMKRPDEAIAQAEKAVELDPRNLVMQLRLAEVFGHAKRYEEAIQQTENVLDLNPDYDLAHWRLSRIYGYQGKFEQAIASMRIGMALMLEDDLGDEIGFLGYFLGRLGQKEEARTQFEKLDELASKGRYISPVVRSLVYVGIDDKEHALALLAEAYETRDGWMPNLNVMPAFDPLRDDPRFQNLLLRMNLEP